MKYEKLFSVHYHHEYYRSKRFNGFGIRPTYNTGHELRSYGIVVREFDGGFTLLYKEADLGKSLLRKLRQRLQLSFFLTSRDWAFMNYSNVPGDFAEYGYWLSNLNENETDPSLTHKEAFLGEGDRVRFVASPQAIKASIPEDAKVTVQNLYGDQLFEGLGGELQYELVRDQLSESGFLNVVMGEAGYKYYYKPPGSKHIVGAIDIIIDPSGADKHNFDAVLNTDYKIAIDSRAATWRYNLINRDEYKYSDFKIFSGKNIVPTKAAEEKMMINGEKGYFIETATPIRLMERYDTTLELEMVKIETDRNIKKRISLPVPDVSKVKVAREADVYHAYSDMYIYF